MKFYIIQIYLKIFETKKCDLPVFFLEELQ